MVNTEASIATIEKFRKRHMWLIDKSALIIEHSLVQVSQEDAQHYRDGANGWTTLEVLAHLRDYNRIFLGRAQMILNEDNPQLPAYDHEVLAIERNYNAEVLPNLLLAYRESRQKISDFFRGLDAADWERSGIHPESGVFSLSDALAQAAMHDIDHTEQITRILRQRP